MPAADYSSYHQLPGTGADGTKFDNFVDAVQSTVNNLDKNNLASAAGILASQLADPTIGKVLGSSGGACAAVYPPGYEFDYKALSAGDVTITGTTDAAATTVIAGNSVTYDGATAVWIEVYAPRVATGAGGVLDITVWEDSTDLGRVAEFDTSAAGASTEGPLLAKIRRTPAAGAHVYTLKAWRGVANGIVGNGAGGAAAYAPAYIRVVKA